ncbi:GNAT family N-acetyltransferase [Tissierella sp. MSJ-40]|uniref:GNAT family N-acetyltransferase n=1 Tax=Tissierella simiarum TaxID=2841534 RepID=A0ABS6EA05_9FIRM|nr:GNAT family N-acetyltransferase [Tissierella simiarum]MBU5439617.1 GNAT family N-acetyltransferase [Tissierella simiarum]
MGIESFSEALTNIYIKNPCRILPNALWKTLVQINNFNSNFILEDDEVKNLKLWNSNMLYTFWDRDKNYIDIDEKDINLFKMMVVHERQLNDNLKEKFSSVKAYFKLIHNNRDIPDIKISDDYYIRDVNIDSELHMVSELICHCYDNIKPSVKEVTKWTRHHVFQKNLWIWVIDKKREKPVALGIAELDINIKEGTLEWVQVLPDYHGNKLGKVLVIELLKRLGQYADFTTVSGELDNKTNAERLYRSCGFIGDDIWYVLRKD